MFASIGTRLEVETHGDRPIRDERLPAGVCRRLGPAEIAALRRSLEPGRRSSEGTARDRGE
jgi:hypothetical protein